MSDWRQLDGLLRKSVDEDNRRRKAIKVTEQGGLVAYAKRLGA